MRLLLYTGKGGVGKTTTAAATAAWAARYGLRTLVLSADSAHSLGDVLELRLGPEPVEVAPNLDAVEVDARAEMARHWGHIRDYLISLFRYQGIEEVVAEELALLPGAEELATLFAVETLAQAGDYDLVVVDCAPTDAALRLATLPEVARASMRVALRIQGAIARVVTPLASALVPAPLPDAGVFGDVETFVFNTLKKLRARLTSTSTSVRIVVTPERMVIDEARRGYTDLCLFDLACDGVVMNRMLPDDALGEPFFASRAKLQAERLEEVRDAFAPLPVRVAPLREDEVSGLDALAAHGEALFESGDPTEGCARSARIRYGRAGDGYRVTIPLAGEAAEVAAPGGRSGVSGGAGRGHGSDLALDVVKLDDELLLRVGARRRALRLPPRMVTCDLVAARRTGDALEVTLGPPERAGHVPAADQ
jgi:arsenite-transporting ATPase